MSPKELEQEAVGAIHQVFRHGKPLSFKVHGFQADKRDLHEIPWVRHACRVLYNTGIAGVLKPTPGMMGDESKEEDFEKSWGAFQVWAMATGRSFVFGKQVEPGLLKVFVNDLRRSNSVSERVYLATGGDSISVRLLNRQ